VVVIAALGHKWDDGVVTIPATYTTPGIRTFTCQLCQDTYTVEIPILTFIYGDVTNQGFVNTTSVTALALYLAGYDIEINLAAADVDGDGKITMTDLAILQRHVAGWNGYDVLPYVIKQAKLAMARVMTMSISMAKDAPPLMSPEVIEGGPTIKVAKVSAKVGEIAKLPISIANNPGIVGMRLFVAYDDTKLKLTGCDDKGLLGVEIHSDQFKTPYILLWENGSDGVDISANGEAVVLNFEVLAKGVSDVSVSYGEGDIIKLQLENTSNLKFENIRFGVANGSVTGTSEEVVDNNKPEVGGGSPAGGSESAPSTKIVVEEEELPLAEMISIDGFIKGFEDNTFRGESLVTREQFVTILCRIKNPQGVPVADKSSKSFGDVEIGRWSFDAIEWAKAEGIAEANEDGNFRPLDPITRAEMAVMFVKIEKLTEIGDFEFSDIEDHANAGDILKAAAAGIFKGYTDGSFKPDGKTTRNEMVAALVRYLIGGEPTEEMLQGLSVTFTDVPSTHWAYKYIALSLID
jgi:hypothetical protein